ncbi:MAG: B12-binding domain-containing radical SAM protein [Deferribacteres bacterium]|nr:B12-binding domain-containing radical SAM protein [candidate division KSB1 bacterium]MCB9501973.1 B12-binding domain-containing radical SAM protein [Deferribacteres bacterium]
MRVTFVQPYYRNVWENIGLGYIIAYCKQHFPGDLDVNFYQGNFDSDAAIVRGAIDSDIVAFSATSPCFPPAVRLAAAIKAENPNVRTVVGGWHVTALQEKALNEFIDQIVVGEGEQAMLDILQGNTDRIVRGTALPFSSLPWPDREAIKNHRTVNLCETMNGQRTTSFQANRVCPTSCVFCAEKTMTGKFNRRLNPIRSRPVEDVCDEIASVVEKYDLTYFKFVDATFDITPQYVIDFCREKIDRGIETEWECLIHASFCNEEMFYWLKESNCNQINVGCESGSPKILKQVKKGTNVETIENVFRWAKNYGINRRAFFILGMPEEDREDLRMTEELIDRMEPDVVGFTILCPYPGSSLYDHEKYGDQDWEQTDEYSNDFWRNKAFSNQELKDWQAYFIDKYSDKLCERLDGDFGIAEDETNLVEHQTSSV